MNGSSSKKNEQRCSDGKGLLQQEPRAITIMGLWWRVEKLELGGPAMTVNIGGGRGGGGGCSAGDNSECN